ncbi:hypothetical protein [Tenacibaculum maritimum]|uniref:hypothetical protein n=1 Tax=Tenacibaculum maritimum TaxID=107401 RepID=UPI00387636B8
MSNPIYGLACPRGGGMKISEPLNSKGKQCGCNIKPPKEIKRMEVGSQIFDNITNSPFDTEVHIQNLDNGEITTTKVNGQFVIAAAPTDRLKITHVGYGEMIVSAADLTDKVVLSEAYETLDEIAIGGKNKASSKKGGLVLLGLAATLAIVYASADDEKKQSNV